MADASSAGGPEAAAAGVPVAAVTSVAVPAAAAKAKNRLSPHDCAPLVLKAESWGICVLCEPPSSRFCSRATRRDVAARSSAGGDLRSVDRGTSGVPPADLGQANGLNALLGSGADDGNRTRVFSLGS